MADYAAMLADDDTVIAARPRTLAMLGGDGPAGGTTTTTYCYRTALGVRGTTTDPAAIPAGAEVERVVVT